MQPIIRQLYVEWGFYPSNYPSIYPSNTRHMVFICQIIRHLSSDYPAIIRHFLFYQAIIRHFVFYPAIIRQLSDKSDFIRQI